MSQSAETRARLKQRYASASPKTAIWSDVIDSLLQHRSVRAYSPKPLPAGTIETLVAAAQSAATSSNLQTWSVVAVQDAMRKSRLAELAGGQKHIEQAPLFMVWLADLGRAIRMASNQSTKLVGTDYVEAFLVAVIDAAIAAQNATVAAESLGLGTVYIGAMRNQPLAVARELGLPPGTVALFGLCVGHADPVHTSAVKPRLPQAMVLHLEQYSSSDTDDRLDAYNHDLAVFQHDQGMRAQRWSDMVLARLGSVGALSGRDKLRDALVELGFPLR